MYPTTNMKFQKIVRYVGANHCMLQYPLSTGESQFSAGIDYTITNKRDYARLVKSGEFVDVTPVVEQPRPEVEEDRVVEETELVVDVPTSNKPKRNKEVTN